MMCRKRLWCHCEVHWCF